EEFEQSNRENSATIALLLQELIAREATITDFFLAYVYSDVDSVEDNLDYLDKQLRDRRAEENLLYIPPKRLTSRTLTANVMRANPPAEFKSPNGVSGEALLGNEIPWRGREAELRTWWRAASTSLTPSKRDWLLYEARAFGLSVGDLYRTAGGGPLD